MTQNNWNMRIYETVPVLSIYWHSLVIINGTECSEGDLCRRLSSGVPNVLHCTTEGFFLVRGELRNLRILSMRLSPVASWCYNTKYWYHFKQYNLLKIWLNKHMNCSSFSNKEKIHRFFFYISWNKSYWKLVF